ERPSEDGDLVKHACKEVAGGVKNATAANAERVGGGAVVARGGAAGRDEGAVQVNPYVGAVGHARDMDPRVVQGLVIVGVHAAAGRGPELDHIGADEAEL